MWQDGNFQYSNKVLQVIADNYTTLYADGLCFKEGDRITDYNSIAEFLCDFDYALSSLGVKWDGLIKEFKEYRSLNRYQRIIIASILGIPDIDLINKYHFRNPEKLRIIALSRMKKFLNGVDKSKK
jgi:hypothetical protein